MKRIALSLALFGMLAVFNAPANASDLSVFLRGGSHGGHYGNVPYGGRQVYSPHLQNSGHRSYRPDLGHQSYRYPASYGQQARYYGSANRGGYPYHVTPRTAYQPRAYPSAYGASQCYGNPSSRYGSSQYPRSGFSLSIGGY